MERSGFPSGQGDRCFSNEEHDVRSIQSKQTKNVIVKEKKKENERTTERKRNS